MSKNTIFSQYFPHITYSKSRKWLVFQLSLIRYRAKNELPYPRWERVK